MDRSCREIAQAILRGTSGISDKELEALALDYMNLINSVYAAAEAWQVVGEKLRDLALITKP